MVSQNPKRIDDGNLDGGNEDKKRSKVLRNKKRKTEKSKVLAVAEISKINKKKSKLKKTKINKERTKKADVHKYEVELDSNQQSGKVVGANADKKGKKVLRNKNKKNAKQSDAETTKIFVSNSPDDVDEGKYMILAGKVDGANADKKMNKVKRNKNKKNAKQFDDETTEIFVSNSPDDVDEGKNKKKSKLKKKKRNKENTKCDPHANEVGDGSNQRNGKSKSASQPENDASLLDDDDEVYQISSGDEDETTGMKKWIADYHHARPGVETLWMRINDFLADYSAQKEKERNEREAEAAEGGWTVVAHHKGRKKTTESESGITVGSVSQVAVIDKMAKKKNKEVGLNFYRFQRREAQRNEIMTLQSKFEQDKKRIQQMRAARKFRPY